jgi:hypothetical protein
MGLITLTFWNQPGSLISCHKHIVLLSRVCGDIVNAMLSGGKKQGEERAPLFAVS